MRLIISTSTISFLGNSSPTYAPPTVKGRFASSCTKFINVRSNDEGKVMNSIENTVMSTIPDNFELTGSALNVEATREKLLGQAKRQLQGFFRIFVK